MTVTSMLRSSQTFPKVHTRAHTATVLSHNMALIITSIKPINPSYFTTVCDSVRILVLLLVSSITVMFHLGYLFHCLICVPLRFYHCTSY